MKKISLLFLLIFSVASQGQTYPTNPTKFGKISINTNGVTTSTTRINSQNPVTGEVNYIDAVNLPVPSSVTTALSGKENLSNKQNSLATDLTNEKYPTVTAVNVELSKKAYLSTGLIRNGLITINANPTKYNVAAGVAMFADFTNADNPTTVIVNFAGVTGKTPAYLNTGNITYVGVNSAGTIVESASPFTTSERRSITSLGAVIHSNLTTINVANNISDPVNAGTNQLHDLMDYVGALNLTGNKYSANGANLSLNKSAGMIFKKGVNFVNDWTRPHEMSQSAGTALTFRYRTQNGTEGSDVTVLNPTLYDLNNVLTTIPNNKYSVQTVTMFQTGLTRIQYDQSFYNSLAEAEAAVFTRSYVVESNIALNGITRAYIIVKKETADLQSSINGGTAKIIEAQKFGGTASGGVAITSAAIIAALGYTPANDASVIHTTGNEGKTGVLTLDNLAIATNANNSSARRIDQAVAGNDFWRIYGESVSTDQGIMVFQVGDNGSPYAGVGQKFSFRYDATSSGVAKTPFEIDYSQITSRTDNFSIIGSDFTTTGFNGITISDPNADRLRVGYNTNGLSTGLVSSQVIASASDLNLASRDISAGSISFRTGAGITERARLLGDGTFRINNLAGTGVRNVTAAADGTLVVGAVQPLRYTALISQSGTSAPTVTVLENNIGGTVVWGRSSVGNYTGTLSGAFSISKTIAFISGMASPTGFFLRIRRSSNDVVQILTSNSSSSSSDDILSETAVRIEVYP
jgi:hypothetical protein